MHVRLDTDDIVKRLSAVVGELRNHFFSIRRVGSIVVDDQRGLRIRSTCRLERLANVRPDAHSADGLSQHLRIPLSAVTVILRCLINHIPDFDIVFESPNTTLDTIEL